MKNKLQTIALTQGVVPLYTRKQVAERLGICVHTVKRLSRRGILPALVFNQRLIRYRREDIETLIAEASTH